MKVKIDSVGVYNSEDVSIMLILSAQDKDLISRMASDNFRYCCYPDKKEYKENNFEKVKDFMKYSLKCPKCKGDMKDSKALIDIIDVITPDFIGQSREDARKSKGQTMSPTGKAKMIDVYKCSKCGFSITK